MHELVGLGHSVTRAVVDSHHGEARTPKHVGISLAEEGWTIAHDNETLVAALTCNVLQQRHHKVSRRTQRQHQQRVAAFAVAAPAVTALPYSHALPPRTVQLALARPTPLSGSRPLMLKAEHRQGGLEKCCGCDLCCMGCAQRQGHGTTSLRLSWAAEGLLRLMQTPHCGSCGAEVAP
jgi:hypothetical protein